MTIKEWRQVFKKMMKKRDDVESVGDCFEMNGEASIDRQLSKIKKPGTYKIFYMEVVDQNKNDVLYWPPAVQLKLAIKEIVVDETRYL